MAQTTVDAAPRPQLVAPREARTIANPFTAAEISAGAAKPNGGLIAVEQQRAVAEVQARMIIARANPRDPIRSMEMILNDCTRPSLAEASTYAYARGGTDIRGPSIRLAEAMAQRWGNIASGIKELARHGEYSECVAYAWDLETGFYDERQFQVRHWRDTRSGGYLLTDERDIYELIANFGQRRKRAVILTVIPGDVTEAALQQCEETMLRSADVTPEGIKSLVEAFAAFGVIPHQLEQRIQRRLNAIRPAQVIMLRKIYASLRDGMSEVADWFEAPPPATETEGQAEPASAQTLTPAPAATTRQAHPESAAPDRSREDPPAANRPAESAPSSAGRRRRNVDFEA